MKIGVLGGTFDPVHRGHIAMAEEVRESLGLDEMFLIPAGQPMSKKSVNPTPAEQRLEMLRLAVADKPHLKISTVELERNGPTYTVDTLTELKKRYGDKVELYFILGWDSLSQLSEWYQPREITQLCNLVAVPRPGFPKPDLKVLEKDIPDLSGRVIFMDKPQMDISASAIREAASAGKDIDTLVPGPVAAYIKRKKLYV